MRVGPSILLIRFSSLGDVVLSSVLLDAIRETYPEAELTLVTKASFEGLFRDDPRITRLLLLPAGASVRSLTHPLRGLDFDLVLDAHGSLRSRLLCSLLAPSSLRRIDKSTFDRWLHLQWRVRRPTLEQRQIDRYLALLPEAGADHRPRIHGVHDDPVSDPCLALAPGARHAAKAWRLEAFATVARRWVDAHGGKILLLGTETEALRELRALISLDSEVPIDDGGGVRDLGEVARDLRRSDLLLANDSGLLHLAEAVGTPVVGIFGPTTRAWGYFPWDERSRVVEVPIPCRPCSRNGGRSCRLQHRLCMDLITVDRVLDALEETWSHLRPVALH